MEDVNCDGTGNETHNQCQELFIAYQINTTAEFFCFEIPFN